MNLSIIIGIFIASTVLLGYLLYTAKKSAEKEKNNLVLKLAAETAQCEQLRTGMGIAHELLERNIATRHLNKRGLIAYLVQRVLFGQEVPESQSTIIRTTIISMHLRYRGIHELESGYRDRILATLLRILRENFPSEVAAIGHFNDGNACNGCIERIHIVCGPIDNASSRARTAIRQFELNTTCPLTDILSTLSVVAGIDTFNTKSYAIWNTLKEYQIGPRTAEAFVLDILERLEHLSGQADDWTIQQITAEPNQTAITTKI